MKNVKNLLLLLCLISSSVDAYAQTFFEKTFTGKYTEQFINGGPKYEVNVKNGLKEGVEIFWYESGHIKIKTSYVADKEHGVWNQWYENGHMKLEAHYKDGREHGSFKQWYDNGQQRAESNFIDGKKQGFEYTWDRDGKLKSRLQYQNGELVKQ